MRNHAHLKRFLVAATVFVLFVPDAAPAVEQRQLDAFTRDALLRAYEDTHAARAFYSAVIARHGKVDPFVGVLEGEERQEKALQALAKANDVSVAIPPAAVPAPEVPGSVKDACTAAVRLERRSVALYDEMMANVKNSAILSNFENYREAAAAHQLPAFERCVARGGGTPPVADIGPPAGSNGEEKSPGSKPDGGNGGAASAAPAPNAAAAAANAPERCDACAMTGCGCSQGSKAAETAQTGTAAANEPETKPAGQKSCGCMRGRAGQ